MGHLPVAVRRRQGQKEGEDRYQHALALWLVGTGDLAQAETAALIAFSIDSTNPEYGTLVARIYDRRNTPALAVDAYERALASPGMTPTAPVLNDLGQLYQRINNSVHHDDAVMHTTPINLIVCIKLLGLDLVKALCSVHTAPQH